MTELLSRGCIESIKNGTNPKIMNVQVLATRPLKNEADKTRLKLTDGEQEYVHAIFTSSTMPPPLKSSIIKISEEATPDGVNKHQVRYLAEKKIYALIISHYTVLKQGVGSPSSSNSNEENHPLNQSTPTRNGSTSALFTPPNTSSSSGASSNHPPPSKENSTSNGINNRTSVKRNLEQDLQGPSPKKVAVGGGDQSLATHSVMSLHSMSNKHKIKVIVESKSIRRTINTRNIPNQVVQDCLLSDSSGNIKLTAWGHDDTTSLDRLIPGKTYFLENLTIRMIRDRKWNNSTSDHELTWNPRTIATGPLLNSLKLEYKFKPIHELQDVSDGTDVDVLAWVKMASDVVQFTARSGIEYKKREVLLADSSGGGNATISLVLWGEEAANFSDADKIIAFRKLALKEFNGVKNLSYGKSSSHEVDPSDLPEFADFETWVTQARVTNLQINPNQGAGGGDNDGPITCIQEIKDMLAEDRNEKKFTIVGYPVLIKSENLWYRACARERDGRTCRKKVEEDGSNPGVYNCRCGLRNLSPSETELRFMVQMNIQDFTSSTWAVMFSAESLFRMSAQEMSDIKNRSEEEYTELIAEAKFTQMRFAVTAKVEIFNGDPKLKLTVHNAERIWGEEETSNRFMRKRWQEIIMLERSLGVSHEEEFGIDVKGAAAIEHHN